MCLPAEAALSSSEVSGAAFKLYACYCAHREGFEARVSNEQAHAETGVGYAYVSTLKTELLEAGWIGLSNETRKGVIPLKGFGEEAREHVRASRKLSKIESVNVSNVERNKVSDFESPDTKVSINESSAPEIVSNIERTEETFENRNSPLTLPHKDKNTSIPQESSPSAQTPPVGLSADVTVEERAKALKKAIAELPKHKRCAQPKPDEWEAMLDIFGEWKREMGKNANTKLTPERGRAVLDRLRSPVGFTREDFSRAIKGCRASPRHMGDNERGEVYDDLELICRTDQHLERFIGYAESGGTVREFKQAVGREETEYGKPDGRSAEGGGGDHGQTRGREPTRQERNRAERLRQLNEVTFDPTPTYRTG